MMGLKLIHVSKRGPWILNLLLKVGGPELCIFGMFLVRQQEYMIARS